LLDAHADTDILVIPEYTYYSARFAGVDYKNDHVIINCESGLCSITSIGTQKSDMIKNAIESMQQIALTKKVSIVFGTVAERVVYEGYNFTVNSQVIINSNGEIIGTHKKYDIPYSNEVSCQTNQLDAAIICQQVRSQNLDTAIIFELIDKEGNSFTILPSICGEKFDSKYIEKVAGANAYLTVSSDFGGDPDYQNIMLEIQNGTNPFAFNDRGLLKIIREKWINNNVISSKSYLLVSDSVETGKTYPTAGIISWDLVTKIIDLDVTNDYVYGKINLEIKK